MGQRVECLPAMWETWVWSLGWEDPLEKEMATHSSILAWRTPQKEEPGRLQSTGSQRVRDFTFTFKLHGTKIFLFLSFLIFLKIYLFCLWLHWVFVAACRLFSNCSKWRLLSSWGVWASHYSGFTCCRAWALARGL